MAGWLTPAVAAPIALDEAAGSLAPPPDGPDFFDGAASAVGQSVMKGGAQVAQTVALAGSLVPQAIDAVVGDDNFSGKTLTERYFRLMDDGITSAIDHWTPDARTTGAAGRVMGGIAEFAIPLMLGGGSSMATAVTTSAAATATAGADLARAGASAAEAGGVAAVQGVANLVGVGVATRGSTALRRAAFGAGANVAVNMPADAASAGILSGGELADRYDPLALEARAVDLVVGALFGAMTRPDVQVKTGDLDAALTTNLVKHQQVDAAPGALETPRDARAHMTALRDVQQKILDGKPLDGTEGAGVAFRPDPVRAEQSRQMALAIDEESAALGAMWDDGLSAESRGPLFKTATPDTSPDVLRQDGQRTSGIVGQSESPGNGIQDAVMARADEVLSENPDMPLALLDNPDDPASVRRVTAREALDEIKAEAAKNEELARGYAAAINCFLRGA